MLHRMASERDAAAFPAGTTPVRVQPDGLLRHLLHCLSALFDASSRQDTWAMVKQYRRCRLQELWASACLVGQQPYKPGMLYFFLSSCYIIHEDLFSVALQARTATATAVHLLLRLASFSLMFLFVPIIFAVGHLDAYFYGSYILTVSIIMCYLSSL